MNGRAIAAMVAVMVPIVAGAERPATTRPADAAAAARQEYERALAAAKQQYRKAVALADGRLVRDLQAALDAAVEAKSAAEAQPIAQALREATAKLKKDDPDGTVANVGVPRQTLVAVHTQMITMLTALDQFELDVGRFPTTKEGLEALVQRPAGVKQWQGPYLSSLPKDPWGRPFAYRCPGGGREPFELRSLGPDGKEGGGDDISSEQDVPPH